jgi:hypothetical protein
MAQFTNKHRKSPLLSGRGLGEGGSPLRVKVEMVGQHPLTLTLSLREREHLARDDVPRDRAIKW